MINFSEITRALVTQLENYEDVINLSPVIERGEYVNVDPDRTLWIGVYRSKANYTPRTLGRSISSFQNVSSIEILVQESSMLSGADCEDRLEDAVRRVLDGVLSDMTIGGTVDMVNDFEIEYLYNETVIESVYFQAAVITVSVEVVTG